MDEAKMQERVADTLLERGVRFKIPAPFFLRLIWVRHIAITIKPSKYGTLLEMSKLSAKLDIDLTALSEGSINEAMAMVEKHGHTVARWVAVAILNSKFSIRFFARPLAKRLMWLLTPKRLAELFLLVTMLSQVQDFTSIIRFLNTMNLTRRSDGIGEMSQKTSGS